MSVERPRARKGGLVVRDLGDEVVVYELESHRGHCLNRTAALVWRACDGRKTIVTIAAEVGLRLGAAPDEDLVRFALGKLRDARLLDPGIQEARTLTRRQLARRIGEVALLPVVVSLLVPRPSEAATCNASSCPGGVCNCAGQPNGTSCWDGSSCSNWVCCNNSCGPAGPPCF